MSDALADRLGWPVLADPLSGSRLEGTIAAADAIVRTEPPPPECIVMLGAPWLSRALGTFVSAAARAGARIIVVDPLRQWADPLRVATEFHQCGADEWLDSAIATALPSDPQWLDSWRERESRAQAAIADVLGTDLSEPLVARSVHRYAAETGATLVVAASMPIRDLEWYAAAQPTPPRVLANRGVNGIDGVVSTALGWPQSGSGQGARTIALLGDLTFLHDVSGLVNLPESPCTFVVLDNGGGGIFSFLPQATSVEPAVFEQLFGTPPTSDIGAVARGFGLPVHEVTALSQLEVGSGRADADARRSSGSRCPIGRRMSRCTMRSTRRSVSRCSKGRRRRRGRAPSRRALEATRRWRRRRSSIPSRGRSDDADRRVRRGYSSILNTTPDFERSTSEKSQPGGVVSGLTRYSPFGLSSNACPVRSTAMDRISKSNLDAFSAEQSLGTIEESVAFELFADYCVVSDAFDEEFDVDDVHVGGGNDLSLDGIAIIVNGALVSSVEEVEDLLALNGALDVTFVFVQAKRLWFRRKRDHGFL